jgi:hypothetical protein
MNRSSSLVLAAVLMLSVAGTASAQAKRYPLENADGIQRHNVAAEPAVLAGKKGLRVTVSEEQLRRRKTMTPEEQNEQEELAPLTGLEFTNGVIEVELAGAPAPDAPEGARGFVGIAFRLQSDMRTYDAFYIRPTNGRADDQERRNHSAQYISHPDWPWFRLRRETPSRYESYVDLVTGAWTKIRIEVQGARARLFVHGQDQPTLVVNDLKSGAQGKGGVALWIDAGTIAHFRDLSVAATVK